MAISPPSGQDSYSKLRQLKWSSTERAIARRLSLPKTSSACRHSQLETLIEPALEQRCTGVLNRKAETAKNNPGWAREQIVLVQKTNGSYRRRGPTNTKRRGVGIGDEVLRPEESRRCARVLASPQLSTPERPWPAPDEFASAGGRQNNFAESGATIVHSTR